MKSAGLSLEAIGILIIAFGTALVSTFVGVFLAYILGPLTINISKWYICAATTTKFPAPNKSLPQHFIDLELSIINFRLSRVPKLDKCLRVCYARLLLR